MNSIDAQLIINELLKPGLPLSEINKLDIQLNDGGWRLGLEAIPVEVPVKRFGINWFGLRCKIDTIKVEWYIIAKYYHKEYIPLFYYSLNSHTKEYAEMMAKNNPIPKFI